MKRDNAYEENNFKISYQCRFFLLNQFWIMGSVSGNRDK